MPMERRKAQDFDQSTETSSQLRLGNRESTYLDWIATWAKNRREEPLNNLMQFFSKENLRHAFRSIDGSKAAGYDRTTKASYGRRLEKNLPVLHQKMRRMTYRPRPARLVLIPKPDGTQRPIAISCLEDKIVQKIAADILSAIYEREFKRFSNNLFNALAECF